MGLCYPVLEELNNDVLHKGVPVYVMNYGTRMNDKCYITHTHESWEFGIGVI